MFDVPVQAVTVFSVPILANISHANNTEFSQISSNPLAGAATLSQFSGDGSAAVALLPTMAQARAFLTQASFQMVEPLNFAAAVSLEPVFALPVASDPEAVLSPVAMPPALVPVVVVATTAVEPVAATALLQATDEVAAVDLSTAVTVRDELSQCAELDRPESRSQAVQFQVLRRGTVVGQVSSAAGTELVLRSLQALLGSEPINAEDITPILGDQRPAIRLSDDILLELVAQDVIAAQPDDMGYEWAAISWSDHLRQSWGASPLDAGDIQVMLKGLAPSENQLSGLASWYGPYFHGRLTANGEIFDQNILTAAHKTLPFDTLLQVRNIKNDRTVVVRINDRGPYIGKRSLDLSKAAAQCLGSEETGVIPYEAIILESPSVETTVAE